MPLQIAPFQLPNRPTLVPQNLAALPKMGPPDMVEANMKGIAGLGTAFEGAYERARERGAMDQLSEYYKTHPFASAAGGVGVGVAGNPLADQPAVGATATSFRGKPEDGLNVYNGLVQRGIEPHVAAGMAGNVYTESRFNPGAKGDKGTAIGLAQWRGSRQQGLFAAAQQRGTDWRDPEAQLDHMAAELRGPYAKVYQAAVASGNPAAATAILARGYERPANWALRKTLGERTGAAQSIFALGQGGGPPAAVAAAGPGGPGGPGGPVVNRPPPVVPGGVAAPPPVGLPPPDPTPDNVANAKAIMQQPTSDPPLKAWAGEVLRKAPGVAGQVPTANAPAPGAAPAGLTLNPGQEGAFNIPSTGEQVPIGMGPDRLNAANAPAPGAVPAQGGAVPPPPLPPQRPPGTGGTGGTPAQQASTIVPGQAGLINPQLGEILRALPPEQQQGLIQAYPEMAKFLPGPQGTAAAGITPGKPIDVPAMPGVTGPVVRPPQPAPAGGVAAPGTFRANEALAIAARGNPQVFAAMLRQYGGGGATGGEWSLEHDGQGNWMKLNKQTGEVVPLAASQGQQQGGDVILPPGDPRRTTQFAGQMPNDGRTYRAHLGARGWEITPVDEREAKSFEHQTQLAQSFEGNQTVKNFRALTDATGSMRASFSEGTPAGDINGVIQVLKAIDPGSTVTQNEQGMIESSGGLPGWASAAVARLNGGAPLTDQMRADFVNAADAQHRYRWNQTKTIVEQTRNTAKANGLDPGAATNGFTDPVFPERATKELFPTKDPTPRSVTSTPNIVRPVPPNAQKVQTEAEGDALRRGTPFVLPNGIHWGYSSGANYKGR